MNNENHIKRRQFLQAAGIGAASTLLNASSARPSPSRQKSNRNKPNVLLIMTDQHRADLMTCAGRELVPTPNIDRIAARGIRFNNAYCPYPVCVASRMAMLTGLYSHSTGAITNRDKLDWRYRTMPNHFAENGYLTGLIGKMHFCDAHNHGFEYYMSINDWLMYLGPKVQHYANEIANHPLGPHFFNTVDDGGAGLPDVDGLWPKGSPWVGNVENWNFDSMASPLEAQDHLDSFIARESGKFITRYREQPFFLVTSFMKPHSPFYPPREWADKYPVDKMTLPDVGDISGYPKHIQRRIRNKAKLGEKRQRAHRAGYLGNLAFVDTCIGHVYDVLEKERLLDNTIVVYTSDHGEMDGDHGLFQKFCLFESSVRVPLIVSWPKNLPEDRVTDALTEYIGLYPTLSDLAGIDAPKTTTLHDIPAAPEQIDARSFAEILRNPDLKGPSAAFSEYNLRSAIPEYMIRTNRYKYIYNHGATHELYDHENDPGEFVNHINDPALRKIRKELHDRLFAWYNPDKNPYRPV
jgi:choline-sulfatase